MLSGKKEQGKENERKEKRNFINIFFIVVRSARERKKKRKIGRWEEWEEKGGIECSKNSKEQEQKQKIREKKTILMSRAEKKENGGWPLCL